MPDKNQWTPTPISDNDWNALSSSDNVLEPTNVPANNVPVDLPNNPVNNVPEKQIEQSVDNAPWQPQAISDDDWNAISGSTGEVKTPAPVPTNESGKYNVLGGVKDVGKLLYDIPIQTKGALGNLLEDKDPDEVINYKDKWVEEAEARVKQRTGELTPEQRAEKIIPLPDFLSEDGALTRGNVQDTSASTGFSLVGMGASILGGVAGTAGGAITGPGAIAAGGAGALALGGTAAYRMDRAMITKSLFKATEKELKRSMTDAERKQLLTETEDVLQNHALWEAGPEAVGNAISLLGLGKIFKGATKGITKKIASGIVTSLGGELATESVTQIGQSQAERMLGMRDDQLEFDVAGIKQAVKEVAPQVITLTGLMGGGAYVGGKIVSKETGEEITNTDKVVEAIKSHGQENVVKSINDIDQQTIANETLLNDPQALEEKATKENISPEELIVQLQEENAFNQQVKEGLQGEVIETEVQEDITEPISDIVQPPTQAADEASTFTDEQQVGQVETTEEIITKVNRLNQEAYELERKGEDAGAIYTQIEEIESKNPKLKAQFQVADEESPFKPVDPAAPEFKQWFEGSQVVDENNNPLEVYHGSTTFGIDENASQVFDPATNSQSTTSPMAGLGSFFATDINEARGYTRRGKGKLNKVYLNIKNPLVTNSWELPSFAARDEAQAFAKRQELEGYDGIFLEDEGHYIAFNPTQVKSAEINTGEFDPNNPDIRFQAGDGSAVTSQVSLEDIKKTFSGQKVYQDSNGKVAVHFKNGQGLTIQSVQKADNDFVQMAIRTGQMKKNGTIRGVTVNANILLSENFADNATLWHENKHVLDNLGIITQADNAALNKEFNKLRKAGKLDFALSTLKDSKIAMEENRANMLAQIMVNREAYRNTPFGKTIQRIMDFFNQLLAFGQQSVSGLAREFESGKIYSRTVNGQTMQTTVPQFEQIANKWYSTLVNAVDGFQQKQATPDQWKGMIKNYPGIKQEELEWMGLDSWLDDQKGKVSKDELMKFVQDNNVQLEEVIKTSQQKAYNKLNEELKQYGYYVEDDYGDFAILDLNNNAVSYFDMSKEAQDLLTSFENEKNIRHQEYQLPGGKNYKELLITAPEIEGEFINDAHFKEPNILAHVRFNERTDSEGNKVLFLEEVQSDWHQEGRKKGYKQGQTYEEYVNFLQDKYKDKNIDNILSNKASVAEVDEYYVIKNSPTGNVPDAPFKKTWPLLTMKRMVRYAAENGFDKIAWTTGQQQADRYDLSKQVDKIIHYKIDDTYHVFIYKKGNSGLSADLQKEISKESELEDFVGKEIAEKIINNEGEKTVNGNVLSNVDLKVGGEGMKAFYDKMLPSMVNKEFNRGKWGKAKVEKIESNLQEDVKVSKEEALKAFDEGEVVFIGNHMPVQKFEVENYLGDDFTIAKPVKQLSLPITDRMKSKALREGMPQFQVQEDTEVKKTTLNDILIQTKQAPGLTGQLANFLSEFIHESKLDIPVTIDPSVPSSKYNVKAGITLNNPSRLATSLHEIIHGVTIKELATNEELRKKVNMLMNGVRRAIIRDGHLTEQQLIDIRAAGTSKNFKDKFPEGSGLGKAGSLAYAMLNNKEFLAQAFSSVQVQEYMRDIRINDNGVIRSLWDTFLDAIMNAFGIERTHKTAFGEVLKLTAQLANQEEVSNVIQSESHALDIPEQKLSDAQYTKRINQKNNLVQDIIQNTRIKLHEAKLLIDKSLGSISTRLWNINPLIMYKMRDLDFRTSQKIIAALKTARPLLKATKHMSKDDKFIWDQARKEADTGKIQQIAEKYGLIEDVEKLRDVLNIIRKEAEDVGYDVGFIDEYWPRVIKDREGFLQATEGISDDPVFTNALKAQAEKMGISFEKFNAEYPDVKADIISNLILGRGVGIGGPGNIQSRVFETIPDEYVKYYMDSDAALMQYIYSMTKKIEARRFFGKVPKRIQDLKNRKKKKTELLDQYQQMAEAARANNDENLSTYEDQIIQMQQDIQEVDEKLENYKQNTRNFTENIGTYIDDLRMNGQLHKKDEKALRDILDARFHEHGTTGIVNAYKNLAYIDTMGSPISALTQIGDLAWAMYVGKVWTPKGFSDTVKNVIKAVFNKSGVTKEDLGIERIAQEFADGTTLSKAVNKVFWAVGLTKIDSIGKEALINNALDQYKAQASTSEGRKQLLKNIRPIFGKESGKVIENLLAASKDSNIAPSDNVKMLLYSKLLDFQPVALSEMTEFYLKGGNGRVFYMLKTYTLKQFDVFRKEVWRNIKEGAKNGDSKQIIRGLTNMSQLLMLLTLANAGADELKDFVLGKEVKFKDNVIENFLTIGGASRYTKMQVTREGIGSALAQQILPPFKFVNSFSKDVSGNVEDGLRSVESIPVAGKWYYWHYGRGSGLKKTENEQEFSKVGKDVRKLKKKFDDAEDKREFIQSNLDAYKQMKVYQKFQSSLSRNQAVINKLKDLPQTTNVVTRLGQLEDQREKILDSFFTLQERMD